MSRFVTAMLLMAILAPAYAATADDSRADRQAAMIQRIDSVLGERWASEGVSPAAPSDDSEFVRREWQTGQVHLIGLEHNTRKSASAARTISSKTS